MKFYSKKNQSQLSQPQIESISTNKCISTTHLPRLRRPPRHPKRHPHARNHTSIPIRRDSIRPNHGIHKVQHASILMPPPISSIGTTFPLVYTFASPTPPPTCISFPNIPSQTLPSKTQQPDTHHEKDTHRAEDFHGAREDCLRGGGRDETARRGGGRGRRGHGDISVMEEIQGRQASGDGQETCGLLLQTGGVSWWMISSAGGQVWRVCGEV